MFPTSYQQFQTRIRQMRRDHHGCTSRGLDVEFARYFYETSFFGEDPAELLADLQRCAADCIGPGCEPRFSLPGQDGPGSSLAAPVEVGRVEESTQQNKKAKPARAASGKRSAEAARAGLALAINFGVQGCAASPAFPVPVGNTGTDFRGVASYA